VSFAFAGTPQFASWVLDELTELGRVPKLVISQPDRPRGRGRAGAAPHAVTQATCRGLECVQTEDISSPEVLARIRALGIDTLVVAAFGQLLRKPLLEAVTCVNIHASLLPMYRGAAPVERALMAGEGVTGVSIMRITEGLDEGPWAEKVQVSVGLRQDAGSVSRMLAVTGAAALDQVLVGLQDGNVRWTEQEGEASYAAKLSPADWWLDVSEGSKKAHNQVRALCPAVGVRGMLGDTEVKIWRSWPYGEPGLDEVPDEAAKVAGRAGAIGTAQGRLFVGCGRGAIEILEIQPASRARMHMAAFLRGYSERLGAQLRIVSLEEG
jgi:methionyl-tRNA formyltransferase